MRLAPEEDTKVVRDTIQYHTSKQYHRRLIEGTVTGLQKAHYQLEHGHLKFFHKKNEFKIKKQHMVTGDSAVYAMLQCWISPREKKEEIFLNSRSYDTVLVSGTSSRMKQPSLPVLKRVRNFFDTIKRASDAL